MTQSRRGTWSRIKKISMAGWLLMAFISQSCDQFTHETGDTALSYVTTDFMMLHTDAKGLPDYGITDQDQKIMIDATKCKPITPAKDTIYRVLMYYDAKKTPVKPKEIIPVPILMPVRPMAEKTDDIELSKVWVAANGKYINLMCAVKTGHSDKKLKPHTIYLCADSVTQRDGQPREWYLTIKHKSNGHPQHYTINHYVSISLNGIKRPIKVHIGTNHKGSTAKTLIIN